MGAAGGRPPLLDAYQPDFLVISQLGADAHYLDPLAHLSLTTQGYVKIITEIARRAKKWIAVGGGGYEVTVVPRVWTLAWSLMVGEEPPEFIPKRLACYFGEDDENPVPLHDATKPHPDRYALKAARAFAEESIRKIKELLFPRHGLSQG